jgi:hypothetical protein
VTRGSSGSLTTACVPGSRSGHPGHSARTGTRRPAAAGCRDALDHCEGDYPPNRTARGMIAPPMTWS